MNASIYILYIPYIYQLNSHIVVCAIKRIGDDFESATPLAGDLMNHGGGALDPEVTRLSTSDSHADSQKQGLRLVMKGGYGHTSSGVKREQRTIIEFLCNKDRNGTEGEYDPEDDKYENDGGDGDDSAAMMARSTTNPLLYTAEDDGGEGDGGDGGDSDDDTPPKEVQLGIKNDPSLLFNSYEPMDENSNIDVLRLTWLSKYACEKRDDSDGGADDGSGEAPSPHWGFFTWLVIL